jgi:predicted RNA-binding protein with EMAP domain
MQEDEQNEYVMLRTIFGILSFMVLADARQNLEDLRDLESNLLGISSCFLEPEYINDIRIIDNIRSKYKGRVAILRDSAKEIIASFIDHPVDVPSLLNLTVSQITWGDQGLHYAFVLGKGSIGSPEEVEQVFSEVVTAAIDHWKGVRGELASIHCLK